jgi:hypothetical protein
LLNLLAIIKENSEGRHNYQVQLIDAQLKMKAMLRPKNGKLNASNLLPLLDGFSFIEYEFK